MNGVSVPCYNEIRMNVHERQQAGRREKGEPLTMADYAKVVVPGTPISKSNFKMVSKDGRFFMPHDTGSYSDRYSIYETSIALLARSQNPGIVFTESLIAVLKVFYKSEKRHPDTNNITKSIFDGIEKSGLIINDAQVTRLVIEEYYDKENPRFELELFKESIFNMEFTVIRREEPIPSKSYEPPSNTKGKMKTRKSDPSFQEKDAPEKKQRASRKCSVCDKTLTKGNYISGNGGSTLICKNCFAKLL